MSSSDRRWRLLATLTAGAVPVTYARILGLASLERQLSFIVLLYFFGYLVLGLRRERPLGDLPNGRVIAIIPTYNEQPEHLHEAIRSLLRGTVVPEVIHVVDDGSAVPAPRFSHPQVVWHRQPNRGKHRAQAAALRAELRTGRFDFVVTVDSDSVVDRYAVERCLRRFSEPKVNAVTGVVYALNRPKNLITRVTDLHYAHSCLVVRDALSRIGDIVTTSGALAVYRAPMWLANLEEYVTRGIADDRHLTHIGQRRGKSLAASDAIVYTFVPDNVPDLIRQRIRWSRDYFRCVLLDFAYLPGRSFWLRAIDFVAISVAPILAVTAFMVFPFAQWRVPWTGVGLWVAFLYVQTSCYLFRRQDLPLASRLATWLLLTPALYLLQVAVIGPAMIISLVNVRRPSWQTRNAKPARDPVPKPDPASSGAHCATAPHRDTWFDLIRMLAISRVVLFHATGFSWLVVVFPSMGIMFGLAGSLAARSLLKVGDRPEVMIWKRLRRLVPSVWALGAVLVPVMLYRGWGAGDARPFTEASIIAWILPLSDPPGNDWAAPVTGTLWYIRTYLWLVFLSVPLLAAFRRAPWSTICLPLALIFGAPYLQWNRWLSDVCLNLGTYATCWLLGFAHRTGRLGRLSGAATLSSAVVLLGAGFGWMKLDDPTDLWIQGNSFAQALWCVGFVLVFFRFRPPMGWFGGAAFRSLRWLVRTVNSRAVTIYLWHQLAIVWSDSVLTWMGVWNIASLGFWVAAKGTVILAMVSAACLVFGRIEDDLGRTAGERSAAGKHVAGSAGRQPEKKRRKRSVPVRVSVER